jgi:hypothetical protein
METNFNPTLLHSAEFVCPDDGPWARARAAEIGDLAFVLDGERPPWQDSPEDIARI